jgi:hypothetical protein
MIPTAFIPAVRAKVSIFPNGKVFLAQLQELREGFGSALVLVFMVGFFWGVLKIWGGANAISKGDSEGKSGILAGIIIASAATLLGVLYRIFGMSDAVVTPRFTP